MRPSNVELLTYRMHERSAREETFVHDMSSATSDTSQSEQSCCVRIDDKYFASQLRLSPQYSL